MWSTNTSSSLIPRLLHQAQIILEQDLAWLRPTPITKSETSSYTGGLMASWRTVFTASMGKHFFRDEFWPGLFILRSLYSILFLFSYFTAMAVVITASVRMLKPNSRNVHFLLLSQSPLLGPPKTAEKRPPPREPQSWPTSKAQWFLYKSFLSSMVVTWPQSTLAT